MARLMVYVDDVLITGPESWTHTIMKGFQSLWECKAGGILGLGVTDLNFLGMALEYQVEDDVQRLTMHQKK